MFTLLAVAAAMSQIGGDSPVGVRSLIDRPGSASDAPPRIPSMSLEGDYYLEVFANGRATHKIVRFRFDGLDLYVSPQDLGTVGIAVDPAIDPGKEIRIADIPGVQHDFDIAALQLHLDVQDDAWAPQHLSGRSRSVTPPLTPSATGVLLNYSLSAIKEDVTRWDDDREFEGVSGSFDTRFFSRYGALSHGFVTSTDGGIRRLQTTYTYSDQRRLLTFNAGDIVSGGLPWTRPVFMAGLQIRRDFGLREDLVTIPTPGFGGTAAVPSTVDIYLQNARIYSSGIDAGPYQISDLPIVTGGGVARVVVRGLEGQETVSELPFYASSRMLRRGLLDYSAEAGFARRGFGGEDDAYDSDLVASGSLRYGVTDRLTVVGHAEGGAGLVNAGAGATWLMGHLGTVSLAGAMSDSDEGTGGLANLALELEPRPDIAVFLTHQRTVGDYADLASVTARTARGDGIDGVRYDDFSADARPPREMSQVSIGLPVAATDGSFGLAYTGWTAADGDSYQTVSVNYSQRLWDNVNFFVNGYSELGGEQRTGVFFGISVPLGGRRHASVGGRVENGRSSGSVTYAQSGGNGVGDLGYTVRLEEGDASFREASATYRTSAARLSAAARHADGRLRVAAQVDGSIVAAGGDVFFSDRVGDAFAIVKAGTPGVSVLRENRVVGRSNGNGAILVPDLVGFASNRLSIDPADVPINAVVTEGSQVVVPASRGGVIVDFAVQSTVNAALVTFVDGAGAPLPVGSKVFLNGEADAVTVGYDGEAWVDGLEGFNSATIRRSDGATCGATFNFQPVDGEQVSVRGVQCS